MITENVFLSRDIYKENYRGEPNSVIVNPFPGRPGYRLPAEYFPEEIDLAWPGLNENEILKFLEDNRYLKARKIKDGSWAAIFPLAYTWSVCTDITKRSTYAYRWCFKDPEEAIFFLERIEEFDEIPTRTESLQGHRFESGFARVIHYGKDGFRKW